jgi:hypothetical protein
MHVFYAEFALMIKLYVKALNSPGGIPAVGSTWQLVLEATYTDATKKALTVYNDIMTACIQHLPMNNIDLMAMHERGVEESVKRFSKAVSLDSESELYRNHLQKLMVQSLNSQGTYGLINLNTKRRACMGVLHLEHRDSSTAHATIDCYIQHTLCEVL